MRKVCSSATADCVPCADYHKDYFVIAITESAGRVFLIFSQARDFPQKQERKERMWRELEDIW